MASVESPLHTCVQDTRAEDGDGVRGSVLWPSFSLLVKLLPQHRLGTRSASAPRPEGSTTFCGVGDLSASAATRRPVECSSDEGAPVVLRERSGWRRVKRL